MSSPEYLVMSERIAGLEQEQRRLLSECRRWRRVGTGMLAGLLVVALAGAKAVSDLQTVEAGHFVLRDTDGRIRAALAIRPDGTPGLGFFDAKGTPRMSFDLAADGAPGVNLYDTNGILKGALAIRPDGTPGLGLFGTEGKVGLSLDITPKGTPGVNLFDPAGQVRGALAIRPNGTPGLGLFDERGNVLASFEAAVPQAAPARPNVQ